MIHNHLKQQHIGWIDYAKSIAIFSVVVLHTHCVDILSTAINAFVMPLFFFISGFLFSRKRNPEFGPFLSKRFRQLIIPYLWINAIAYILWLTVLRHFGSNAADSLEWHEPLLAIVLGIPKSLVHDIPLWSILCFFVVEIVYYLLPTHSSRADLLIAVVSYIAAAVISMFAGIEGVAFPMTSAPATAALSFYALGNFTRKSTNISRFFLRPSLVIFCSGATLLAGALYLNIPTAFFIGILGNPLFFMIGAMGGMIVSLQCAIWMDRYFHDNKIIRMISRGTLLICGFHLLIFAFIKGVMLFGFGIPPEILTDGLLQGILLSIATVLLCLPIIYIIERYLRILVSK